MSDALIDAETRHAWHTAERGGYVSRRMVRLLERCHKDIMTRLAESNDDTFTRMRLEILERQIRERMEQLQQDFTSALTGAMGEIAEQEAKTVPAIYKSALTEIAAQFVVVPMDQVRAAALSRPFQGVHLRWANAPAHADEMVKRQYARMRDEIRRGFVEGDSIPRITSRIREVLTLDKRTAETIARTAVTHTASAAKRIFIEANRQLFKAEVFTAVLDGRTSKICRAHSGKVYPVLEGPQPPLHPNCRSQRIGWADGYPKPQARDYEVWLREQTIEDQDRMLGKAKGKLFRDGKLTLSDLFNFRKGREYTLEELYKRERDAFKAAGVEL